LPLAEPLLAARRGYESERATTIQASHGCETFASPRSQVTNGQLCWGKVGPRWDPRPKGWVRVKSARLIGKELPGAVAWFTSNSNELGNLPGFSRRCNFRVGVELMKSRDKIGRASCRER